MRRLHCSDGGVIRTFQGQGKQVNYPFFLFLAPDPIDPLLFVVLTLYGANRLKLSA